MGIVVCTKHSAKVERGSSPELCGESKEELQKRLTHCSYITRFHGCSVLRCSKMHARISHCRKEAWQAGCRAALRRAQTHVNGLRRRRRSAFAIPAAARSADGDCTTSMAGSLLRGGTGEGRGDRRGVRLEASRRPPGSTGLQNHLKKASEPKRLRAAGSAQPRVGCGPGTCALRSLQRRPLPSGPRRTCVQAPLSLRPPEEPRETPLPRPTPDGGGGTTSPSGNSGAFLPSSRWRKEARKTLFLPNHSPPPPPGPTEPKRAAQLFRFTTEPRNLTVRDWALVCRKRGLRG